MELANEVDDPRTRFEAKLSALRGRRITAVDYWDLHHFGPDSEPWDYGDWHHAVMGVELTTDLGPVTVTWTDTFFPYGVEVFHDRPEDHLVVGEGGPQRNGPDADPAGPWTRHLGSPIRGTASHWSRQEMGPARRADGSIAKPAYSVDLPTAIRVDFDAGSVWFVAAIPQPPEMQRVFIPGDEIMVVFSSEKMRDMGFGGPAFLR
ncbi:hypothetical protein GCM10027614_63580 [Micromonospora vulcania]